MKGVLIVNMGGVSSESEAKVFLRNMFNDPCILPFNRVSRHLLSFLISSTRYKKSWQKYQLIGGTPILRTTKLTTEILGQKLGNDFKIRYSFSYTNPYIQDTLSKFEDQKVYDIIVIPLYPHYSLSTTKSVENDVNLFLKSHPSFSIKIIREFYNHKKFIDFWSDLILKHISEHQYKNPLLVFSAHSIPKNLVNKGDLYPSKIAECAQTIAKKTNREFQVAFQSAINKKKWVGPDIQDKINELVLSGVSEIIIIPISFVSENLETCYDLDKIIVPWAQKIEGIEKVSRVKIPENDSNFLQLLFEITKKNEL